MDSVGEELESLRQDVSLLAMDILSRQKNYLQLVATRFPSIVTSRIERNRSGLQTIASPFTCDGIGFVITPPVGA